MISSKPKCSLEGVAGDAAAVQLPQDALAKCRAQLQSSISSQKHEIKAVCFWSQVQHQQQTLGLSSSELSCIISGRQMTGPLSRLHVTRWKCLCAQLCKKDCSCHATQSSGQGGLYAQRLRIKQPKIAVSSSVNWGLAGGRSDCCPPCTTEHDSSTSLVNQAAPVHLKLLRTSAHLMPGLDAALTTL